VEGEREQVCVCVCEESLLESVCARAHVKRDHAHVVEGVGERVGHDDRPVDRKKKLFEGVANNRYDHLSGCGRVGCD
jgi:hypothetical protein